MNISLKYKLLIVLVFALVIGTVFVVYSKSNKNESIASPKDTRYEFINKIEGAAIQGWDKYKIYPSITIAQAIIESGWGKSNLTKEANNLFGLKADKNGDREYLEVNGIRFKKYKNIDSSIEDHVKFISEAIGEEHIKKSKNFQEQIIKLQLSGYSADTNYSNKVIKIIEEYNLNDFDKNLGE